MKTHAYVSLASGTIFMAYAIDVEDKRSKNKSKSEIHDPLAFDLYDLWLGNDFNFVIDELLDELFD